MPIYEYQCRECGTRLEKIQRIADPPLTDCPSCESDGLVKLVSAASFRLKGGGWYETDFKKDGKRNLAGDDKPADKSPDQKTESGTSGAGKGETKKGDTAGKAKPASGAKPEAAAAP